MASGCLGGVLVAMLPGLYDRTDPLAQRRPFEGNLETMLALPGTHLDQTEGLFTSLGVPLGLLIGEEEIVPLDDIVKRQSDTPSGALPFYWTQPTTIRAGSSASVV